LIGNVQWWTSLDLNLHLQESGRKLSWSILTIGVIETIALNAVASHQCTLIAKIL
jgi:hypothetical protein